MTGRYFWCLKLLHDICCYTERQQAPSLLNILIYAEKKEKTSKGLYNHEPRGMHVEKDYYEILGVRKDATGSEIKREYFKKARIYHPDKNPGQGKDFEQKFEAIQEAYETLNDEQMRLEYNLAREKYFQAIELEHSPFRKHAWPKSPNHVFRQPPRNWSRPQRPNSDHTQNLTAPNDLPQPPPMDIKDGDYENFATDIANWGDFESKMLQMLFSKQQEMEYSKFDELSIKVWIEVHRHWEAARKQRWYPVFVDEEL